MNRYQKALANLKSEVKKYDSPNLKEVIDVLSELVSLTVEKQAVAFMEDDGIAFYCPNCEEELEEGTCYCGHCGQSIKS